jgi:hypothetical protein
MSNEENIDRLSLRDLVAASLLYLTSLSGTCYTWCCVPMTYEDDPAAASKAAQVSAAGRSAEPMNKKR